MVYNLDKKYVHPYRIYVRYDLEINIGYILGKADSETYVLRS